MPIDNLTALGQKMRKARKNKELTQQELSDLSHVSVKQIANIEKGKMNPSYLILRALALPFASPIKLVPIPLIGCIFRISFLIHPYKHRIVMKFTFINSSRL